jgi:hypothetical protein
MHVGMLFELEPNQWAIDYLHVQHTHASLFFLVVLFLVCFLFLFFIRFFKFVFLVCFV